MDMPAMRKHSHPQHRYPSITALAPTTYSLWGGFLLNEARAGSTRGAALLVVKLTAPGASLKRTCVEQVGTTTRDVFHRELLRRAQALVKNDVGQCKCAMNGRQEPALAVDKRHTKEVWPRLIQGTRWQRMFVIGCTGGLHRLVRSSVRRALLEQNMRT
ncbi:hypothetical protein BC834DRAFT_902207 [Gloeopeniophorella convolvens]|nr:hypothetical protein BC834DRAFT_902207 [Gloeopeniophorella convolvens]